MENDIVRNEQYSPTVPESITPPKILWDEVAVSYDIISQASKAHIDKIGRVANIVMESRASSVIDLGCGSGVLERQLLDRGFSGRVEALDASDNMLKIAKETIGQNKNVSFRSFDLNDDFDFDEGSFDCAISMNVMFFLRNPLSFLKNIRRVLSTDGYLVLVNPKPQGCTRDFINEHLKNMQFLEIVKELSSNLTKIKHLVQVAKSEKKVDLLHKNGVIHYQSFNEINDLIARAGFVVDFTDSIQANQNWIFVAKKS
jgi:ubiquinone/menaquinone biosynthesis C-methylase UbiE